MIKRYLDLQRFAGDGAAGDGAGTGGEAGPAEAETVPVPEDLLKEKLEKEAKEAMPPPVAEDAATAAEPVVEEPAPEPVPEPETIEEQPETKPEAEQEPAGELTIEERLAALEEKLERQNQLLLQREQDLAMREHFAGLEQQGEALKEVFPEFDLKEQLADPVFVRLTSPMVGLSVEDAYYALHHKEITAAGAQAAAEMLGNSVKAGKAMPGENGVVQRGTPDGFRPLADLSPEERKLRMDLIRSGKLTF